jgi:acetyl-CoA synthetase
VISSKRRSSRGGADSVNNQQEARCFMGYKRICKAELEEGAVRPNMISYEEAAGSFKWEDHAKEIEGFENGGMNIAYEAIDRHIKMDRREKVALFWEGKGGESRTYTFLDFYKLTNRFANALASLGVKKGDRVFTYMDRIPETYICLLGALKVGGVIGPLFSAFGPDAVKDRLSDCEARVLVTTPRLAGLVREIREDLPALEIVIVVNRRQEPYEIQAGEVSYEELVKDASEEFDIRKTQGSCARARGRHRALGHSQVCAGSARGRHLLVYG